MEITEDNKIKVIASYSDNKTGLIKGVVNCSIDLNSDDNPQLYYNKIDEELILQYCINKVESENIKKSYKKGINKTNYSYLIEKVITHKEGYFAIIQQKGEKSPSNARQTFWFREFIVASYDNNDKLNWISKCPGMFSQFYFSLSSIECMVKDGELILVYPSTYINELKNTSNKQATTKSKNKTSVFGGYSISKVYMTVHKFDINGKVEGDILCDLKKLDIAFFSSFSAKPINNSIVFFSHNAKYKYKILRFDFK